jgi:hypothetical protein
MRIRKPRRHTLTSLRGARFHCAGCNADFRGYRAMNAHHLAKHASRWTSKSARAAGRKMGKETDNLRRHALGWLEAAGLREWKKVPVRDKQGKPVERNGKPVTREVPVLTDRARSRPQADGRPVRQHLRQLHRHDRHHERADGHDRKAQRHRAKGRDAKADAREARARALRDRWTQPARPAPDDDRLRDLLGRAAAQTNGNGTRTRTRPAPDQARRTR